MGAEPFAFGLLRRRSVVLPTWRTLLAMLFALALALRWLQVSILPFLAVTAPVGGEALIVEGWIPDYALREALATFRSRPYKLLIVTGGPVPQGMAFSYHGTYARLGAAMLEGLGLPADSVAEVPSPEVPKDRTYTEAVCLSEWMRARGIAFASVDLFSFSAHGRRSRLLFEKGLGKGTRVGIYSPPDAQYDPLHWWRTSNGVRRVTDEGIAYLYAKLLFRE